MFGKEPSCIHCGKTIEGNEKVYIQMRYPKHRGMTEVKAYWPRTTFSFWKKKSQRFMPACRAIVMPSCNPCADTVLFF